MPVRKRRRCRWKSGDLFVQLPFWVLETPATRALSATAFKLLVYILKRYNGSNNGRIAFGARSGCFVRKQGTSEQEDCDIGIQHSAVAKALAELQDAGLIHCQKLSSFDQKRCVREWRLTWLPMDREPATKEFAGEIGLNFATRKKQKPVRRSGLLRKLQSDQADEPTSANRQNGAYSPSQRTMDSDDSPLSQTHLRNHLCARDTSVR